MNASFEEKSIWVQLLSLVVVLGGYFVFAGQMMASGVDALIAYLPLFMVTVVLIVAVITAGHIVVAIVSKQEGRDERDRLIGWRAESNSSWILGAGVIMGITGMVFSVDNVWVAQWLLFSLFLSQVVSYIMQLLYYRRGV